MGTLIELASGTLDTLGHLISRPAGQALTMTAPTRPSERPLDVRAAILATRRTTEAVLFYATTQLGAWVTNPDLMLDAGAGADAESADEVGDSVKLEPERASGSAAGADGDDGTDEKGPDGGNIWRIEGGLGEGAESVGEEPTDGRGQGQAER
ncbi:hypothetical protein EDB92DRAFT_1622182 [Lactarius akahatsu]|uniref:Uncharacterized protein n=1 Tax=Lactarius akahatsu TaxID=416441 RepID=A0AAD4L9K7_9AGAM|nr:hypothetical protein EDB92DRAFT_1622182 [Lactarius akahatsu]